MYNSVFLVMLAIGLVATYRAVPPGLIAGDRPVGSAAAELISDRSGWWIGLLLGFGAIAAVGVAAVTEDQNFRVFALMFASFCTAMSAAEIIRRVFAWRRIRASDPEAVV